MKLGIFAKTFDGTDPRAVLQSVAAAGYAGAQYNMACSGLPSRPDEIADGQAQAVADAARACSVAAYPSNRRGWGSCRASSFISNSLR